MMVYGHVPLDALLLEIDPGAWHADTQVVTVTFARCKERGEGGPRYGEKELVDIDDPNVIRDIFAAVQAGHHTVLDATIAALQSEK